MSKREIKNCPFCGSIAECTTSIQSEYYMKYKVECAECFCRTDFYDHPEIAVNKWNIRLREIKE